MADRKRYKGRVIEARSNELRDGLGWDGACCIEEPDGGGITITPFFLTDIFPTQEAAIQTAFHAGQQKIDSGFEHKFVVDQSIPGENSIHEH